MFLYQEAQSEESLRESTESGEAMQVFSVHKQDLHTRLAPRDQIGHLGVMCDNGPRITQSLALLFINKVLSFDSPKIGTSCPRKDVGNL